MDLNYFLNYLNNSLQEMNADVKKLYSNKCNKCKVLDHLSHELTTLEKYTNRFRSPDGTAAQEKQPPTKSTFAPQSRPVMNNNVNTQRVQKTQGSMPNTQQNQAVPNRTPNTQQNQSAADNSSNSKDLQPIPNVTRKFTTEELAKYDGKSNNAAYVAINGTVYDVTDSPVWLEKIHFGLTPGRDLTNVFEACHPGANILVKLTKVGILV